MPPAFAIGAPGSFPTLMARNEPAADVDSKAMLQTSADVMHALGLDSIDGDDDDLLNELIDTPSFQLDAAQLMEELDHVMPAGAPDGSSPPMDTRSQAASHISASDALSAMPTAVP